MFYDRFTESVRHFPDLIAVELQRESSAVAAGAPPVESYTFTQLRNMAESVGNWLLAIRHHNAARSAPFSPPIIPCGWPPTSACSPPATPPFRSTPPFMLTRSASCCSTPTLCSCSAIASAWPSPAKPPATCRSSSSSSTATSPKTAYRCSLRHLYCRPWRLPAGAGQRRTTSR